MLAVLLGVVAALDPVHRATDYGVREDESVRGKTSMVEDGSRTLVFKTAEGRVIEVAASASVGDCTTVPTEVVTSCSGLAEAACSGKSLEVNEAKSGQLPDSLGEARSYILRPASTAAPYDAASAVCSADSSEDRTILVADAGCTTLTGCEDLCEANESCQGFALGQANAGLTAQGAACPEGQGLCALHDTKYCDDNFDFNWYAIRRLGYFTRFYLQECEYDASQSACVGGSGGKVCTSTRDGPYTAAAGVDFRMAPDNAFQGYPYDSSQAASTVTDATMNTRTGAR